MRKKGDRKRTIMEKGYKIDCLDKGHVIYVDHYGSDSRVVEAARVSYAGGSKGDEKDKKLLDYLFRKRHTSPFEQCAITFQIKLPLFIQAQMVRHRTQKLNQQSARYTEMSNDFYIPEIWRKQNTENKQGSIEAVNLNHPFYTEEVETFCKDAFDLYENLLEAGISREMARMVLPQNLYTEIYSCWDVHNFLHFANLRRDRIHAQSEIVTYADAMFDIFKELFPWTAEASEKYKFVLQE
jgi:thymidylate synthase (FAD)